MVRRGRQAPKTVAVPQVMTMLATYWAHRGGPVKMVHAECLHTTNRSTLTLFRDMGFSLDQDGFYCDNFKIMACITSLNQG